MNHPDAKRFGPGTFGCHEAMDRTSVLMGLVGELAEHDAIRLNPQWERLATKAHDALFDLYQKIGMVHLTADEWRKMLEVE